MPLFCSLMRSPSEPFLQALESSTVIGFEMSPIGVCHLAPWNNHNVYIRQWFMASKELSNKPLRAVTDDSITNLVAGGNAESRSPERIRQGETGHKPAPQASAALIYAGKVRPLPQLGYDDTDNRLRPLARRRLRTVRPFFVAMRTRKPCVRRRRR
jgi:hypothetical protein